jgi:predicted ATP-dependent endonuclease of OLD family
MKIVSLQLSNILSFKYFDNIQNAEKVSFDDDLNIIIGENGSGKSTALEVINFLFRRVLYKQYNLNQDLYTQRSRINAEQQRQILLPADNNYYSGFRLDPNWNTEDRQQVIRVAIKLDDIDRRNLDCLQNKKDTLIAWIGRWEHPIYASRFIKLIRYCEFEFIVHFFAHKTSRKLLFSC